MSYLIIGLLGLGAIPAAWPADGQTVDGSVLFQRTCAMCHGQDGKAGTPIARRMGVKDLSASSLDDDGIRRVIREGMRGPKGAMPAFGAKFSEAELGALVAHVKSLRPAENDAKP